MLCNLDRLVSLVPAYGLWLFTVTIHTNISLLILLTVTCTYTLFPIQATHTYFLAGE